MAIELDSLDPGQAAPGTYRVLTQSGSVYIVSLRADGHWTVQRLPAPDAEPQWVDELTRMTAGFRSSWWVRRLRSGDSAPGSTTIYGCVHPSF